VEEFTHRTVLIFFDELAHPPLPSWPCKSHCLYTRFQPRRNRREHRIARKATDPTTIPAIAPALRAWEEEDEEVSAEGEEYKVRLLFVVGDGDK
jgi:hypothetical protein